MLWECFQKNLIELSYVLYRNSYFLVKKKEENKYRFINNAVEINRVIIKNGNLSSAINEFSEKFSNYIIISLIDFFSGYDQIEFDEKSKDLISFYTLIRFYRITILPQDAINLITQFIRVITKILQDHLSRCLSFIDDIGIKNPKIIYNNEKMTPGIRKYMLEHIQWLDGILTDLKYADYTISDTKS